MRKVLTAALSTMMVLSLAACGGSDSSADTTAAPETEAEVTVETEAETEEAESEVSLDELPDLVDVEGGTLWDIYTVDTPDLTNTSWGLSGGYFDGEEMTQDDLNETLEQYSGQLDFNFGEDGVAQMVQGAGTMDGTYEYLDDGSVGVIFDNNGEELRYACLFTEMSDTLVLVAIPDETGTNGLYFSEN